LRLPGNAGRSLFKRPRPSARHDSKGRLIMTTLLAFYVAAGVMLVLISIPLLLEKVPPNPLYGFRLSPALDDPKIWYATNKHSAKRVICAGASTVIAAVALYFVPAISLNAYALGCLAVFTIVLVVGLVQSVRFMKSLARPSECAPGADSSR
jgi:hypothetical protein